MLTTRDVVKRNPEVPQPCDGYAIVRVKKLDASRTEAGVIVPNFTPGQLHDDPHQFYERYTVVSTSGCWYAGSTRVEHHAKPGDTVLLKPQSGYLDYSKDPRWPLDHRLIALQDVCSYWACKTGEPMSKGDA